MESVDEAQAGAEESTSGSPIVSEDLRVGMLIGVEQQYPLLIRIRLDLENNCISSMRGIRQKPYLFRSPKSLKAKKGEII